jgi:LysM repeat protein
MSLNTNKIKLSPRLRWGIGRNDSHINFFKIAGVICLVLAVGMFANATYKLLSGNKDSESNPQVLGAVDKNSSQAVFKEYKVKKGDTLFTISKDNNVDWTALATLNNLKPPFALSVNQTIKIPQN